MESLLVINVIVEVSLQMTLHIVLCASIRSQLKKLLKFASKWERNNEMKFGIDKCEKLIT